MQGMGEDAFYFSYRMENLLFYNLTTTTPAGMFGLCLGLIAVSVLFESLKFFREFLFVYANEENSCDIQTVSETSQLRPCGRRFSKTVRILFHLCQAVLHMKQIFLGYIVMLCIMSFNAWFFIVAVFGLSFGYFLCGAIFPKNYETPDSNNCQVATITTSRITTPTTLTDSRGHQ